MRHLRSLFSKLGNLILPGRADNELDREVSSHLTLLEDEFVRRGLGREEARIQAQCWPAVSSRSL